MHVQTFIIQPVGDLLIDVIQNADGYRQQDFRQELAELEPVSGRDLGIDPVLDLEDPEHYDEDHAQTDGDDGKTNSVPKQGALPGRIIRLQTACHWAGTEVTLG